MGLTRLIKSLEPTHFISKLRYQSISWPLEVATDDIFIRCEK